MLQLQKDILETKKSLKEAKRQLERVKGDYPFNSYNLVQAVQQVENYENGLKVLEKFYKEEFQNTAKTTW